MKNLGDAIGEEIRLEYGHLKQVAKNISADPEVALCSILDGNVDNTVSHSSKGNIPLTIIERREKLELKMKLKKDGYNLTEISRRTKTDWRTVKNYLTLGIPSIGREPRVNYNKYDKENYSNGRFKNQSFCNV